MRGTRGQVMRLARRSLALALALAAVWLAGLTADLSGLTGALGELARDSGLAVALLHSELPPSADEELGPWQRLVLGQSPLLAHRREAVSAFLQGQQAAPEPDGEAQPDEDDQEPPIPAPQDEDSSVVAQTMVPVSGQSYLQAGDVYIVDRAGKEVDAAALAAAPVDITLGEGPQILILHTHGSEAYTQSGADVYEESDPYRTTDCNFNMVRVGEEMARVFEEHGFTVVHDTNLYDYPAYNGAYDRSLEAAEYWLNQYPSIQIVLDVHRDALAGEDGTVYKAVFQQGDSQAAQVMLVVGTDGAGSYHPLWQENLTFAMRLQQQMAQDCPTLARPMVLRSSRFNQQLSVGSLLVEVGTHGNTLQEALAGARLFAESASRVLEGLKG